MTVKGLWQVRPSLTRRVTKEYFPAFPGVFVVNRFETTKPRHQEKPASAKLLDTFRKIDTPLAACYIDHDVLYAHAAGLAGV